MRATKFSLLIDKLCMLMVGGCEIRKLSTDKLLVNI